MTRQTSTPTTPRELYHVSEQRGLGRFEPRAESGGAVWAITAERLKNYLLPRDCPRVTFYARAATTADDRARFLGESTAVVAIESAWYERAVVARVFVYAFDAAPFELADEIAGYYTTHEAVDAIGCREIENPIAELLRDQVEVRLLPSLWALREAVASSTLGFSVIRMRNAAPPPAGFESRFPVYSPGAELR